MQATKASPATINKVRKVSKVSKHIISQGRKWVITTSNKALFLDKASILVAMVNILKANIPKANTLKANTPLRAITEGPDSPTLERGVPAELQAAYLVVWLLVRLVVAV